MTKLSPLMDAIVDTLVDAIVDMIDKNRTFYAIVPKSSIKEENELMYLHNGELKVVSTSMEDIGRYLKEEPPTNNDCLVKIISIDFETPQKLSEHIQNLPPEEHVVFSPRQVFHF